MRIWRGAVGRAVIYEDDFLAEFGFNDAAKDLINRGLLVTNGNHHGKLRVD